MRLNNPGDLVGELSVITGESNHFADIISEKISKVVIFPYHKFKATENDTEVAAGYLSNKIEEGLSLKEALEESLNDLDGFFTFTVGTKTGFAVLRDPIACKPAVIAETEDWVAMSSEYRALAKLPDVSNANVWEPKPGQVYSWGE